MATDLTLYLDDQPGELARVGDALGKAGTNIVGLCALTTGGGQAEVHILVQDATLAFEALQNEDSPRQVAARVSRPRAAGARPLPRGERAPDRVRGRVANAGAD